LSPTLSLKGFLPSGHRPVWSACLADSDEPSNVIRAMKPQSAAARQMIRFSLGIETRLAEMNTTVTAVVEAVGLLRH